MFDLREYVLCDKDDTHIAMMTTFPKPIAHTSTGICVVQQVIQYINTIHPAGF